MVPNPPSSANRRTRLSVTAPALYKAAEHTHAKDRPMDEVKDSNGNILKDGDNVTLIKDLKVKGSSITLKRGTLVKGIRLTNDPAEIDCRVEKVKGLVLRTEFVRKA
jgi:protein PhnA